MTVDTGKAKTAIEMLQKYVALCKSGDYAAGDHPVADPAAVVDLIETYEWLLERREHLALDHDALKREHETMTDWKSEQVGALMIAATEAIDTVERVADSDNLGKLDILEEAEAKIPAWRAAVSRTNPAPIGAGDGTP